MTQPPVPTVIELSAPERSGVYHHMTDEQRQKAVDALKRGPYPTTRPARPSIQDKIEEAAT